MGYQLQLLQVSRFDASFYRLEKGIILNGQVSET